MRSILLVASAAIAITAAAATAATPEYGTFGFDVAGMDKSVAPGNDWGGYANGTYVKNLTIPADKSSYTMFAKLGDLSQARTRTIVEAAAAATNNAPGSEAQKVGDFYASFVDEAGIEAKGIAPLKPALDKIAAISDRAQLAAAFGEASRTGVDVPIGVGPGQDLKNPDIYTVYAGQGGLGMPDRDYHLDTKNPKFAEVRTKYQQYIVDLLTAAKVPDAAAKAKAIYDLEVKIATSHWTRVEQRQVEKLYNPVAIPAVGGSYAGVEWQPLLAAAGVAAQPTLIVTNPSAIQGAAKLVHDEPLDTWKAYLAFHTLDRWAADLPSSSSTCTSPSTARCCRARPRTSRGGSAASTRFRMRWAKRRASFTSPSTSRPRPRPRRTNWSGTLSRQWTIASPT